MIEFGHSLRQLRTDRHLTQQAVADKLGLTRQTISKWENGKGYPDFENLLLLCAVYDVSIDQVLNPQTLHLNPQEKIRSNQKEEQTLMLTKRAKWFVLSVLAILVVVIGTEFISSYREDYQEQQSQYVTTKKYFVTVTGVRTVTYTHDQTGTVRRVKSVVLNNGKVLHYPTIADLKAHRLVIPAPKPFAPSKVSQTPYVDSIFKSALVRNE